MFQRKLDNKGYDSGVQCKWNGFKQLCKKYIFASLALNCSEFVSIFLIHHLFCSSYVFTDQKEPTLQDVLMFGTGLRKIPPASIQPLLELHFEWGSCFPLASTRSNIRFQSVSPVLRNSKKLWTMAYRTALDLGFLKAIFCPRKPRNAQLASLNQS